MWNELRKDLGDDEFWAVARSWLADNDNTSASRREVYDHWEAETGRELSAFFRRWISGDRTPRPGVPSAG
jgi:aminopeptidase N